MALGGGTWTQQDKILPGAYINFSSAVKADSGLSERGIVAVPLALSWGPEKEIFELKADTVSSTVKPLLGYDYSDSHMTAIRELFKNASRLYCYRINSEAVKATNSYATAKYGGVRGNDIKIAIAVNADDEDKFDVTTYVGDELADRQVKVAAADLKDNPWVSFKKEAFLAAAAATPLTGGTNGSEISGADYTGFLSAVESHGFNILCCPSADAEISGLFTAFTKRLCEESGANFQTVCYKPADADYEGVIGVWNPVSDQPEYGLVYWVAGAEAACPIGASLTNRPYDGELKVDTQLTQDELKAAIEAGKLVLHSINGIPHVLEDINSLTSFTGTKTEDFRYNQTIRVLSGAANDIAAVFKEKYLGRVPNNQDGRISLWNDICKVMERYRKAGAIEPFDTSNIEVLPGESKKAVVCNIKNLSVVSAMSVLYMSVVIA